MTGWHYTTYANWLNIQKVGLVPSPLSRPELKKFGLPTHMYGTYVWDNELTPENELGILLYVLSKQSQLELVRLRIDFLDKAVFVKTEAPPYYRQNIQFFHSTNIDNYQCIKGRPSSHILVETILPKDVTLEKRFNLLDIVNSSLYGKRKQPKSI